ncbi:MAG TPA: ArsA-related P-loop ATPase [Polyangiaceae bacterium LLY-WYZ-14_1]|nr:ArsA-related P-loop ATPase [Polyangiaceae bacterium LLY-WYZ-14_1]
MGLGALLDQHAVVVVVGSGGVGKTTTAAALAVDAARRGQRVLCLTIDPARRLAQSLGLARMTQEEQRVDPALFAAEGVDCPGSLHAMMLDSKGTFDELVARHAPDEDTRERILGNRMYRYVSSSLAGVREYMAMEKLHAVREEGWDLIVLDTPPTSNALDFLDAPERLVGLVDSPATRWFIRAYEGPGRLSLDLVGRGAAFILKGLSRFTGSDFLADLAEFVTGFESLFGGFKARAEAVAADLRGDDVAFLVVTSPAALAVDEAIFFDERLAELGIRRHAFVVNAVRPLLPEPRETSAELARLAAEALSPEVLPPGLDAKRTVRLLRRAFDDERLEATRDRGEIDRLRRARGQDVRVVEIPAFEDEVHDLGALARVADHLTAGQEAD